jgi:hypothetical protein
MTIADFLKKYNKTHGWLASEVGVYRQAVGHWVAKNRYPRRETAQQIVTATKGKVTIKDIYA